MKHIHLFALLAVAALLCPVAAQAQFRFGLRAGVGVNKMHFSEDVLDSDNRTSFTGGVTAEFTVPVVGLAFDASLMYAHRSAKYVAEETDGNGSYSTETFKRDYIDIPVNLKYKIGLPVVGSIVTPYLFTGPDFAILVSDKDTDSNLWKNKRLNVSWNVGAGVELVKHLQVSAAYNIGLSKAVERSVGINANNTGKINGKDRCWTITAAYFF